MTTTGSSVLPLAAAVLALGLAVTPGIGRGGR